MNFSIRTLSYKQNGQKYLVYIGGEEKELFDEIDWLIERYRTSGVDRSRYGPLTMTVRRSK